MELKLFLIFDSQSKLHDFVFTALDINEAKDYILLLSRKYLDFQQRCKSFSLLEIGFYDVSHISFHKHISPIVLLSFKDIDFSEIHCFLVDPTSEARQLGI